MRRNLLKTILKGSLIIFTLICVLTAFIIIYINHYSHPYEYSDKKNIPAKRVGIVFGALVYSNHSLSPILKDRVDGAIELYNLHRIKKILMSGDNGRAAYDEVTAMKDYAVKHNIPSADIILDYAGFSTYDSCYRAHKIFELNEAVLITQRYHLARAIYTCRKLGINAVGLSLPDFELYPDLRIPYSIREYGADLKAWLQLNITHPNPKFLGDPIPIK